MKAYGTIELTVASPAQSFAEVLSLSDARTFLNVADVSPADSAQDALLNMYITAARETAEILQGRDLIPKQYDMHLDLLLGYDGLAGAAYPLRMNSVYNLGAGYEIELRAPLVSVDLYQYTDSNGSVTTLTENTDYIVDLNRAFVLPPFGKLWPWYTPKPSSSVLIRFTSGFSSTHPFWSNAGQRLKVAMLYLISQWYNGRVPFVPGRVSQEFPNTITDQLSYGARPRVH